MALEVDIKEHVLSPAQEKVFKDLAAGLSYDEIAKKHHRTSETIKSHGKVIRETFQAKSMLEAVAIAIARGVISIKEVGGKALIASALVLLSNFTDDPKMRERTTRVATRPPISRNVRHEA